MPRVLHHKAGQQITVIKLSAQGEEKVRYTGLIVEPLSHGIVLQASWTLPTRDLGYTCFEPQDQFKEYYYTNRWFNVFAISNVHGTHKGWYCNVTEPAQLSQDAIRQVDLLLDVWVNPAGEPLILDEEEFAAAAVTALTERQQS